MKNNFNNAVTSFLEREGINIEQTLNGVDSTVYSIAKLNPIAIKFGMYKEMQDKVISVGDIIGFEDDWQSFLEGRPENVFEGLNMLFAEGENEYKNRALSMLEYSREEVIAKLTQSFYNQPVIVKETGEGTYSIAGNGKHRFMLLRTLYLSELAKVNENAEEVEKLKNKYKIPVKAESLDLAKTYAKYFLMTYGIADIVSVEFERSFHGKGRTGNTIVQTNEVGAFGKNTSLILNDANLIKYTKSVINKNQDITKKEPQGEPNFDGILDKKKLDWIQKMEILKKLPKFYRDIKSFREFFDSNMTEVYLGNSIEIEKGTQDE